MPDVTNDVGKHKTKSVDRTEWLIWRSLTEHDYRQPTFGDYCVQSPNPLSDFNPLFMDSAAQLRYTTAAAWCIARGGALKKDGYDQIHGLAAMIGGDPKFYAGEGFSWGDRWLKRCSEREVSAGDQRTWRKATTNHQLTFVVRQLANLVST